MHVLAHHNYMDTVLFQTVTEGLLDLITSHVRPKQMPMFFWQHLEHDINLLSRATGKSKDEACLLLHLVLRDVAVKNPAQCE